MKLVLTDQFNLNIAKLYPETNLLKLTQIKIYTWQEPTSGQDEGYAFYEQVSYIPTIQFF
jgi:hypothetical protein